MLTTTRLLLRPYEPDDWQRVHLYAAIPEFSEFDVWGPNSVDDTKKYIQDCIQHFSERPILRYELAIVQKDNGSLIGGCSLKLDAPEGNEASLGFAVNPDYQNRGYASESAVALIEFGVRQLGLSLVHATCDTRNTASWKVMERSGMRRVSVLKADKLIRGKMTDSFRYEIRSDEIE